MWRCVLVAVLLGVNVVAAQGQVPRLEPAACPFEMPEEEIEGTTFACSYLVVPENRAQPNGRTIRLMVAEIFSTSEDPEPDPVIYLAGGPGQNAVGDAAEWLISPFLANRDLILLDQRGTGNSEPRLNCPEVKEMDEDSTEVEAAHTCYERLAADGIDLSAYNSAESAADVNDLRIALGYEQVNLFGISYGTRLALTIMRDYPQGIRSVILDSVYPPSLNALETQALDHFRAMTVLFESCAADQVCNAAYPDLEMVLLETVDFLNTEPAVYEVENFDTGELEEAVLHGDDLLSGIVQALYNSDAIPYLPLVITQIAAGDYAIYDELISEALYAVEEEEDGFFDEDDEWLEDVSDSEGMYYSVECYEEYPFNRVEVANTIAEAIPLEFRAGLLESTELVFEVCSIWRINAVDPIENESVVSDIPTLILVGQFDPITPPSSGRLAAETLANHFYLEFVGVGHDVYDSGDCPANIAAEFFDDPYMEPDTTCMDEMTSVEWVLP